MRLLLIVLLVATSCAAPADTLARPATESPAPTATTPAAISATASAAASSVSTSTATTSATRRPNPTTGPGSYTSVGGAYRVDLPAGWRRSACQSTPGDEVPRVDTYTTASLDEESGTDTGPSQDVVLVRIEQNPGGETAIGWLESGGMGFSRGSTFEKITFDGNPDAARMVTTDGSIVGAYVINARFRIYAISRGLRTSTPASEAAARTIMTSLHVLRDGELAEARTTLATPAPAPARSVEEAADTLARGFAQKDTGVLATVAEECLTTAVEQAGNSFRTTSTALVAMQKSFAAGLVVTVQSRPIEQSSGSAMIAGTWQDPGQPQRNVKLMLTKLGDSWYWQGVLYLQH